MTFCTCSETNHALTAFPICEGVGFTDSTFMISASSRSRSISGVAIAVPTPTPLDSESDEKKEFVVVVDVDDGDGPSEFVLLSTPKFKTRLFVSEDTDEEEEEERLPDETIDEGTSRTGDGAGVGGVADASESITTLFKQSLL